MRHFSFVLPSSFDPGEFLKSPALVSRSDDARYFVSLILTKLARRDVDDLGVVRLRGEFLKNIMRGTTYAAVVESLLDGGAIERFPYTVGERSFGFRLASRFVADKHIRIPATDSRLIRRLEKFHEQATDERDARMKPVHRALAKQQHRLRIDGAEARRTLASLPHECNPFDVQGILIADIEHREYHVNVGRYGRIANNITSLKRELRDSLHVNREPLGCVDLSCAQPALLAKLITNGTNNGHGKGDGNDDGQGNGRGREGEQGRGRGEQGRGEQSRGKYDSRFDTPGDFDLYVSLVQTGRFYDFMLEQLRDSGIGRHEFKRRFLADVLAKKGRYSSIVENAFQRLFPSVHAVIRRVNRDGNEHANLIRELQRAESSFVIETVAADLVTRFPRMFLISLHDAIYATVGNVPKVEQAFRRAFDRTGFPMQYKVGS